MSDDDPLRAFFDAPDAEARATAWGRVLAGLPLDAEAGIPRDFEQRPGGSAAIAMWNYSMIVLHADRSLTRWSLTNRSSFEGPGTEEVEEVHYQNRREVYRRIWPPGTWAEHVLGPTIRYDTDDDEPPGA